MGFESHCTPLGHILGSAQVRLEWRGYTVVVTGDCNLEAAMSHAKWQKLYSVTSWLLSLRLLYLFMRGRNRVRCLMKWLGGVCGV